jgi:hypothetical protein
MSAEWWLYFGIGSVIGYQMKTIATKNLGSKVSAIDGGLMLGAVAFFLSHLITAKHPVYTEHD